VELEALDPNDLRALLSAQVNELIDSDAIEVERERQERERARLAELAPNWTED
jgi:hypothetical protein